ncbi:MAG TPA: hypothetical protein VG756_23230 [Pseudonocardiaceae bacterium]|nr:hypothetical protein [Pseudonocardiaceae bacterium]
MPGVGVADLGLLLENYRHNAVLVLASHQCVGTRCSSCGQTWPCRAACAAELALEL